MVVREILVSLPTGAGVVANGARVAQLEQPDDGSEPIVCCRDADGRPVRRPRAAGSPGVRVLGAMRPEFMWSAFAPGIQTQDFPIYAAAGWRTELSECGSEDDGRLTYTAACCTAYRNAASASSIAAGKRYS